MTNPYRWVIDTSAYTHLCRAGHSDLIWRLAPEGIVVVPCDVNDEIEQGRELYSSIPAISSVDWAEIAILTEDEVWTQLSVRAQMSGQGSEHLGECAVIACAHHRNMIAILDERAAIEQADRLQVPNYDTLWVVIEANKKLHEFDRDRTACVVDDLLETGMYLPITSGGSLISWAYEEGLLP